MAFSNYTQLKAAIISYSHRNDINDEIDGFIDLGEKLFYRSAREPLRVREMVQTTAGVTSITDRFQA